MKQTQEKLIKKIRKYTRLSRSFSKGDLVFTADKLCREVLKGLADDIPITIVSEGSCATKTAVPWTLDDEAVQFFHSLFHGKSEVSDPKVIKLLAPLTDEEAALLAKTYNLPFTPSQKDPDIKRMIDAMHKAHPEVKHASAKTAAGLKRLRT